MDKFQHVNNGKYFDYFQEARLYHGLHWDERRKSSQSTDEAVKSIMSGTEDSVIIKSTSCKFLRPVLWPDTLLIGSRVSKIEKEEVWFEYLAWSKKLKKTVAIGDALMVFYDYENKHKIGIPEDLRPILEQEMCST